MRTRLARKTLLYLLLPAGAAATAAVTTHASPDLAASSTEKIKFGFDGAVRSTRALYTIGSIVFDYKYSLRGIDASSSNYKGVLSEIHLRSARRLLELCESNKGFYVKAGQFLSSLRQVPNEYTSTLSSLQDKAVPWNFRDIKEVIMKNLQKDFTELFLSFDEEPIAAASIAQVHHAVLKDNREVAVKVQYPGLEQRMKVDVTTIDVISKFVAWMFPEYRFEAMVAEFERVMNMELDFLCEAKNAERTAMNFRRNKIIKIPTVFLGLTTKQVLTMEFCNGCKVDDVRILREYGINPLKVAQTLMGLFAEMIFIHGFLHGDPHPGNILVSSQGNGDFSLVLLDHGFYTELDETFRRDFCELWRALVLLDSHKIQFLGEKFGVGKYAKYFPVIFTGRTINSKSTLGTQMSVKEKQSLKQDLQSLNLADIASFMESLPSDFLIILRTDGLLRSIISRLGAPRRVRLTAYAKSAVRGLTLQPNAELGLTPKNYLPRIKADIYYLRLRILLEFVDLLRKLEEFKSVIAKQFSSWLSAVNDLFNRGFFTFKM